MLLRQLNLLCVCLILPLALFSTPRQVLIISYAEPDSSYNLTLGGTERANQLPDFFSSLAAQGFGPPDLIFGAQRTFSIPGLAVFQTASACSESYKQPIHVYSPNDLSGLVNTLLHNSICDDKCVLVVWNFAAIPDLIAALGYLPPSSPTPSCYALAYVLPTFPVSSEKSPIVINQDLMPGDSSCGGISPPTPPTPDLVANYISVTIYNGTTSAIIDGTPGTISSDQVYILIIAQGGGSVLQFTSDGNGHMLGAPVTPAPVNGNTASFYTSYYSYALSSFPSAQQGYHTFYLPADTMLPSTRMMFSLVTPLNWLVQPGTGHIYSQDDNFVTTDNTYYTLYDKVEFTITNASLPWWQLVMNSTMVDYYCLPLSFYIDYIVGSTSTTSYTGISPTIPRLSIFSTYQSQLATLTGSGTGTWSQLYSTYTPPGGSAVELRIASANSGALKPNNISPLFPASYLSTNPNSSCQWLSSLWFNSSTPPYAYYQTGNPVSSTLTLDLSNAGAGSGTATGQVDGGGDFVFTLNADSIWYPGTVTFQSPLTIAPFFSGAYTDYVDPSNSTPLWSIGGNATTDTITAVWQIFSCAFNAGYIPPPSPQGTPSTPLTKSWLQSQVGSFFSDNPALCSGPWYNFYSKVLHDHFSVTPYTDFYTAPFDDYLGIDGTITVDDILGLNAGAAVYITVGDMTNSVIPNILNDSTPYNVTFALLPGSVQNVSFNSTAVPSSGGSMGSTTGSAMTVSLQYTTGSYAGSPITTFTAQISPGTLTTTPELPGGVNIVVSGNEVTIYIGAAPP